MKTNFLQIILLAGVATAFTLSSCQETESFHSEEQPSLPVTTRVDYYEIPDDAIDISTVNTLEAGQTYVVLRGYTGGVPEYNGADDDERIDIFVLADWTPAGNLEVGSGIDMYITNLGSITSSEALTVAFRSNSNLYVLEGGDFSLRNGFLTMGQNSSLMLNGTLSLGYLQLISGTFNVGPTGDGNINILVSTGTATIVVNGTLVVAEGGFDEGEPADILYEYTIPFVGGQTLYVIDAYNPTGLQFTSFDNQGYTTRLTTEDFNSIRLYVPNAFQVEDSLVLTYNAGIDDLVIGQIQVTFTN
ncbi:MAG: hypothetical protein LUF04_13155 [Bacteroides sp.]|nr:hypothetical protein [Bacteroides sp.]